MAEPKLARIMNTLAGRLETITVDGGFYTNIGLRVERYPREFNEGEVPACAIFLSGGANSGSEGAGVKTDPVLTVRASHGVGKTVVAEDIAIQMMADVHKAIEQPSSKIPQQPDLIRSVDESGWDIIYPDNLGDIVSVELTYSFSYSRRYGED